MKALYFVLGLTLMFWVVILYLPSFKLGFSLLDDGLMVKNSRGIVRATEKFAFNDLNNIIFEPNQGRVRPAYWLILVPINLISFYNPHIIHLLRFFLLVITLVAIYYLIKKLKINPLWGFLSAFLYATNVQNFENYYRLGPVEPFLSIYFVFTLILILSKKSSVFIISSLTFLLIIGTFTKETYFIPAFVFLIFGILPSKSLIPKNIKQKLIFSGFLLLIIEAFVLFIRSKYAISVNYSSGYKIDVETLYKSIVSFTNQLLKYQFPFIQISILYLSYDFVLLLKKKLKGLNEFDLVYYGLWLTALFELLVLLPWQYTLGRYLIIVNLCLVLIYAITFERLFKTVNSLKDKYFAKQNKNFLDVEKSLVVTFFVVFVGVFLSRNIIEIANIQNWSSTDYSLSRDTVSAIAKNVPTGKTVFVNYKKNDNNLELFLETKWHLEEFIKRHDINFEYLTLKNLCTDNERFIFDRNSDRFVSKSVFRSNDFSLIEGGSTYYEALNGAAVFKSFIYGTKSEDWNTKYQFNWGVYKQKKDTCISNKYVL